jgi:hypothetical protein
MYEVESIEEDVNLAAVAKLTKICLHFSELEQHDFGSFEPFCRHNFGHHVATITRNSSAARKNSSKIIIVLSLIYVKT